MSSLNSILSVARTALQSHQVALQVAGHNLANATTDGFSRQSPGLVPGTPVQLPDGPLGTGVRVANVSRARDSVLEPAVRRETSLLGASTLEREVLGQLESVLGGLEGSSVVSALDAFWNSWSELANDPGSLTGRAVMRAAAEQVVAAFQQAAAQLDEVAGEVRERLSADIGEVNALLGEIAQLNGRIVSMTAASGSAPDLEDRRDLLLDRLASYVPIQVTRRDGGMVGVSIEGTGVVEGTVAASLDLVARGDGWVIATAGGHEWVPASGRVGGGLALVNQHLDVVGEELDEVARALVLAVNGIHERGVGPLGGPGIPFFDDLGDIDSVGAGTLALDAAVRADSRAIVAAGPDGGGGYRPGANDVALELAGLSSSPVTGALGGRSVGAALRDLLGSLGSEVAERRGAAERHELLLTVAQERREAVSGVVTDEELIRIIQIQAAYSAAARVVSVVDEMYQTLMSV